jgi:hypothetical protein
MPKRFAYVKTEKFNGWVCSECGWQHELAQDPSSAELAAAERALQNHLQQEHHKVTLLRDVPRENDLA